MFDYLIRLLSSDASMAFIQASRNASFLIQRKLLHKGLAQLTGLK